jgi:hypothetical protein
MIQVFQTAWKKYRTLVETIAMQVMIALCKNKDPLRLIISLNAAFLLNLETFLDELRGLKRRADGSA